MMYYRSHGRGGSEVIKRHPAPELIPPDYGGSVFGPEPGPSDRPAPPPPPPEICETPDVCPPAGPDRTLRGDDLLLCGLIVLLAAGGADDDVIIMIAFLLLCGAI